MDQLRESIKQLQVAILYSGKGFRSAIRFVRIDSLDLSFIIVLDFLVCLSVKEQTFFRKNKEISSFKSFYF